MIQFFLLEKKTAFKGWLLATIVAFPFTFIPIFFEEGAFIEKFLLRIPESLLYSSGFGVAIVIGAFYQNYTRVKAKIDHYNEPALKSLDFDFASSGQGSLVDDLNFYQFGIYKDRKYRIDMIIDLEKENRDFLVINPIITSARGGNYPTYIKELQSRFRKDYLVTENPRQLEILINLNDINLQDEGAVKKYLTIVESKLS